MKKIFTMLFMLIGFVQLQAQEWNFGVKGGVNFASFGGSDADDMGVEGRTGFHIGGLAEVKLSEYFGVQLEVLYNNLGAKFDGSFFDDEGNEFPGEVTFKLDYVAVPLIGKFYPIQNLNIQTGPQVSFEVTSDVEADANGESVSLDVEDATNKVDFSWLFGLGYDLPYGLLVDGRYALGLSDIYDESNMKHSVIQLSIGYKF